MTLGRDTARGALDAIFTALPGRPSSRVLTYHSIDPRAANSHRPDRFRDHLRRLRELGFRFVTFREVPALAGSDVRWVCITFDDGYGDNVEQAGPILRAEGVVATFFVVADMIADGSARRSDVGHMLYPDRQMMTSDQLRWLTDHGHEVASHSASHRLIADLDDTQLDIELRGSKSRLEHLIGGPVTSFSYPNGQRGAFSSRTERAVGRAGYQACGTTLWGAPTRSTDALAIPRCQVRTSWDGDDIASIMEGHRDYLWFIHRARRGVELWSPITSSEPGGQAAAFVSKRLLEILRCPCGGSFDDRPSDSTVVCRACEARYAVVNGIPRLVTSLPGAPIATFPWKLLDRRASVREILERTGWSAHELEGALVLDAGCGAGWFAEVALQLGAEVVAIDASNAVDECRARLPDHPRLHLVQADPAAPPFPPASFDFVFSSGILQHVREPRSTIEKLSALVKPLGGLFFDARAQSWRNRLSPTRVLRPLTSRIPARVVLRALESAGASTPTALDATRDLVARHDAIVRPDDVTSWMARSGMGTVRVESDRGRLRVRARHVSSAHIHWVTDIPTPYRNHLHRTMVKVFAAHDLSFEVLFMAWTLSFRHWSFGPDELDYPYRVFPGVHPEVAGAGVHVNPALLAHLSRSRADLLVVGGYASVTHFLSPWASHDTLRVLYAESNPESERRTGPVARWIKRTAVSRYDAFLVPQQRTLDLLHSIDPDSTHKPVLTLPNLIEESRWRLDRDRSRMLRARVRRELAIGEATQLWICPARLDDDKGLLPFLPRLAGRKNVVMLVAGSGHQKEVLGRLIAEHDLPVRLLGQQPLDRMVELYAAADLFVLPSLRDPSPLSPIEAMAVGLPLLVSRRIGNLAEVLAPGVNGWSFDPEAAPAPIDEILAASPAQLTRMGDASQRRYDELFDTDTCVERLAVELRQLHDRRNATRSATRVDQQR